ncbi:MAG: excinuclease ABC subunit UvrC [Candidatus Makaraimicrobium thalassicum]|nr:MAG: excinuclease ABC subunit UvrC [Candidatus Omnitrophota bacterium]
MKDKISSKIKDLPDSPGVYEFLDSKGRIIYVGKARRLRRRVASYFRPGRVTDSRLALLRSEVRDIKFIRASSEAEALIYEAGLIKDHTPRFNIELKDDKSYPFLKLTAGEEYPRLFMTRRRLGDGAVYYGPYVNVKLLKEALSFMKRVFPLRSCRRLRKSVCLEYHIGQCAGPCEKKISAGEYGDIVGQLKKFLEGRKDDLIRSLEEQMARFSRDREYEKAIFVKKRIEALTAVQQLHDRSQHPVYGELDELQNALNLPSIPVTIECFDVSNISGQQAVGSMVRFAAGRPRKAEYRKFRIKKVAGIDDYSMIREVVRRRYSRLLKEKRSLPDMVLIDGGKGHLFAARNELNELGMGSVPVASIAKEHNHLYTTSREQPIRLSPGSRLLLLIQRIRDEAHRFAVTYHRRLRRTEKFDTDLRKINGIGPKRERILLEKFGNIENIRRASQNELQKAGIDKMTTRLIVEYLHKGG